MSVRGSALKTRIRSGSGGSYRGNEECEITPVPIEMLGKYEQLGEGPSSPTMGIIPEIFKFKDLERAVIRKESPRYIWQ